MFFPIVLFELKKKLLGRNIKKKLFKYFQILTQSLQVLTKKPHTFCLKYLCSFLGLSTFYRFSFFFTPILREAAKNIVLLMAGPLRGGGVLDRAIKEKKIWSLFFQRSIFSTAIKLEGGGGLGLNGPDIKRRIFFCGFPYLSPFYQRRHLRLLFLLSLRN